MAAPIDDDLQRANAAPAVGGAVLPGDSPGARFGRHRSLVMGRGIAALVLALACIFWPAVTLHTLASLFGAYALIDAVLAIGVGLRAARRHPRWGPFAPEGLAGLLAGAAALLWPDLTALAFVLMLAAWSLVKGALSLLVARQLRRSQGRGWLLLAGAVSLLWGLLWGSLLVAAPRADALALTWWVGAYALAFGVAMLALGARLRRPIRTVAAYAPLDARAVRPL